MFESIKIEGFKKFKNKEIELKKLKKINILVGRNGSGKTSVLQVLEKCAGILLVNYAGEESIPADNENYSLFAPKTRYRAVEKNGSSIDIEITPKMGDRWDLNRIQNGDGIKNPYLTIARGDFPSSSKSSPNVHFPLNAAYLSADEIIDNKNIIKVNFLMNKEIREVDIQGSNELFENENHVKKAHLAGGIRYAAAIIQDIKKMESNNSPFIIIDNFGDQIHPALQKQFLDKIIEELNSIKTISDGEPQVFIATHQINIVKAAFSRSDICNVYVLDDGSFISWDDKGNRIKANSSEGENEESTYAIASMLGINEEVIGLPSHIFLVEETSKKEFLDQIKIRFNKKVINFDVLVPYNSCDSNFKKNIEILLGMRKYFVFNPIWKDRLIIFTDKNKEFWEKKDDNLYSKFTDYLNKNPNQFIFTKKSDKYCQSFEDSYPEKYADQVTSIKKEKDHSQSGKRKSELARKVGSEITEEEFKNYYYDLYKIIFRIQNNE